MTDPKPIASLSPGLLARKGGAKPAMRPQLGPMTQFQEATARQIDNELGWNDLGEDEAHEAHSGDAQVIMFNGAEPRLAVVPEVVRQQQEIAQRVSAPPQTRRSALSEGRRAAFTLRLDAERHLKLRLACAVGNRSAQQIVTEALDRLMDELPDVAALAASVTRRERN